VDQYSHRLAQTYGLTGPQALLLKAVATAGGTLSAGDLARRISLSQATITDIVKRLESRGLVLRVRDAQDRRRVMVQLTEAGQAAVESAPPLLQDRFVARLTELKDWEQHQLLVSLLRIAEMMNAEGIDASPVLTSGPITASPRDVAEAYGDKEKADSEPK
jgi:DNA-binding MarR family transcriptional regulator